MNVPFFKPSIDKYDQENVLNVLNSGWLTTGKVGQQFEQDFAKFIGVKFCVAVNSATADLHLSVLASSIKAGDYVLVPTMTFASTAEVLYYCGVKPLLIDCNLEDLSIYFFRRCRKENSKSIIRKQTSHGNYPRALCRENGLNGQS